MDAADEPLRLVVDGQHFEVRERRAAPGQYDVTWTSGPNPGYGFTSASNDGSPIDTEGLELGIRSFLMQVDPKTGYID
jgi:hypothetical protein